MDSSKADAVGDTVKQGADPADLDRESRTRTLPRIQNRLITILLICFTAFQLYSAITNTVPAQLLRMCHLAFVIPLTYWLYPATKNGRRDRISLIDFVLGLIFLGIIAYYVLNFEDILMRVGDYTRLDIVIGAVAVLLIMEACRRAVGIPLVMISSIFILYAYFGKVMPGFLNHRGYSTVRIVSQLFYSTEGVIGSPLGVCATFVFLFILFGAFLERTGIGQFFTDFANSVAGHSPEGPAKVAVLNSALMGTVSGSSVSNVVTTGSFTIPLMKSLGYPKEFAAGVEASASTGGQIMPPIMGAAAFLISEMINVNYMDVVKAAIIPALLYFTGIYITVDFTAKKLGLRGLPKEQLPKLGPLLLRRGHLLLPLAAIITFLLAGFSCTRAALWGIVVCIIAPFLRKGTRVSPKLILEAIPAGARSVLSVSCACSTAGIVVGIVTMTGLGLKLGDGLLSLTHGMLIPTLFCTMITSIVLGMGVPTTANYLITATVAAPILIKMGVPIMAAHLFSFYFGIMSDVTPPVALAAYAGSAIAKSDPLKSGIEASKLAIGAFLVPYMFAMNPVLIMQADSPLQVIQPLITAVLGMVGISAAMTGFFRAPLRWYERIVLAAAGLMMLYPEIITDIIGIVVIAALYFALKSRAASHRAAMPPI